MLEVPQYFEPKKVPVKLARWLLPKSHWHLENQEVYQQEYQLHIAELLQLQQSDKVVPSRHQSPGVFRIPSSV